MQGKLRRRVFDVINRRARPSRIAHGPMQGLLFTGGDTAGYALGASEPAVQDALLQHLHPGGVLYDIGANVGFMSLLGAKLVGPDGMVYCFEPSPDAVEALRLNIDQNGFTNYEVIQAGVAEKSGSARLALDRGQIGAALTEDTGRDALTIELVALDDLALRPPAVVKIDVEGAESRVLAGMSRVIARHHPVLIVEIHGDQLGPVRAFLRDAGYESQTLKDGGGMPHLLATPQVAPGSAL